MIEPVISKDIGARWARANWASISELGFYQIAVGELIPSSVPGNFRCGDNRAGSQFYNEGLTRCPGNVTYRRGCNTGGRMYIYEGIGRTSGVPA